MKSGDERHRFRIIGARARGGSISACRCGVELLIQREGGPRLYRASAAAPWTRDAQPHVEPAK